MNDFEKINFTNGVIPIWNSLPNKVVSVETVYNENRLDKFWSDQGVLYDYSLLQIPVASETVVYLGYRGYLGLLPFSPCLVM